MKKNDPKRSVKYHKFLVREDKSKKERLAKRKEKRELKDAINGLGNKLSLEDNIEIDMDGPKKIITRRSHQVTMKKKIRKEKKEPIPVDSMDI
jgi:hypothetical protein